MIRRIGWITVTALALVASASEAAGASPARVAESSTRRAPLERRDAFESHDALERRTTPPTQAQIDFRISLRSLLQRRQPDAFSTARGARIAGWVIQVEREEDGDVHLVLADRPRETSTLQWVIVEITPEGQRRGVGIPPAMLRSLVGHRVEVTGWLYYDHDVEDADPRGTSWEIHPVTNIRRLDASR